MRKPAIAFLMASLLFCNICASTALAAPEDPSSAASAVSASQAASSVPEEVSSAVSSDTSSTVAEGWPEPPNLYSQAAILMDADTGQVLCQKNANQRMYPASITKIMTLLLAMELGNPNDTTTMTDEAVWEVPRYATHIALTPGETLTLEQLELAMMVESANDAANGIAVYLGGSLSNFAAIMNRKALELGARNTQFVNANGLPDPNHYTTAYDMALITKAAYAYPEFRRLAGTQVYELPPTNKQSQTRRLVNQQYMFSQGDTYPGAFAGKTGWTQESGKTLVTLAERDGVTLISVVMKPTGAVDGEFKDSTALLDYGFDQFNRTVIPPKRIPEFSDSNGSWQSSGEVAVLLPQGVREEVLTLAVTTQGTLLVDLPISYAGPFGTRLVELPLNYQTNQPDEPVMVDEMEQKSAVWTVVLSCLKWAGIALGSVVAVLVLVRLAVRSYFHMRRMAAQAKQNRIEARRRREERDLEEGQRLLMMQRAKERMKRQQRERREAERTSQRPVRREPPVIDVTIDKEHKNKITVLDEEDE